MTLLSILFLACLLFPSCKLRPDKEESPEESLKERAEAFWRARFNGDAAEEYALLEPRVKKVLSLKEFLSQAGGIKYHAFSVEKAEVEGSRGRVWVRYKWSVKVPGKASEFIQEAYQDHEWVLEDGIWYRTFPLPGITEEKEPQKKG